VVVLVDADLLQKPGVVEFNEVVVAGCEATFTPAAGGLLQLAAKRFDLGLKLAYPYGLIRRRRQGRNLAGFWLLSGCGCGTGRRQAIGRPGTQLGAGLDGRRCGTRCDYVGRR